MSATRTDNADANPDNIIFAVKDAKLYVPVVTLSERNNQILLKLLNFVDVIRLFGLVYSIHDANFKRFKTRRYYLLKDIIKNHNVIVNVKNCYDQAID